LTLKDKVEMGLIEELSELAYGEDSLPMAEN
jgi:hypothetical protein